MEAHAVYTALKIIQRHQDAINERNLAKSSTQPFFPPLIKTITGPL